MPETASMHGALLALAFATSVLGLAWLALAMESHWHQVRGAQALPRRAVLTLRFLGAMAMAASLVFCGRADHASMAALVWVMTLAASALIVAFVFAWRPRWFAPLIAWVPRAASGPSGAASQGH